jgi:hypothetical protein
MFFGTYRNKFTFLAYVWNSNVQGGTQRHDLPTMFNDNQGVGLQVIREHTYKWHLTCYKSGAPYRNHSNNEAKFMRVKCEEVSHGVIFVDAINDNTVINIVSWIGSFQPSSPTSSLLRACIDLVLVTLGALPRCRSIPTLVTLVPCSSRYHSVPGLSAHFFSVSAHLFVYHCQGHEDIPAMSGNTILHSQRSTLTIWTRALQWQGCI